MIIELSIELVFESQSENLNWISDVEPDANKSVQRVLDKCQHASLSQTPSKFIIDDVCLKSIDML